MILTKVMISALRFYNKIIFVLFYVTPCISYIHYVRQQMHCLKKDKMRIILAPALGHNS